MVKKLAVLIDPRTQEKEDARRQEIVQRIVDYIDVLILATSDGSVRQTERLTQNAAFALLSVAFDRSIISPDEFDVSILRILSEESKHQSDRRVWQWIKMQVVQKFVEKAAIPFSDRLREYDLNN
jgi:hypothetical protein